jgi:hypothetical protein
LALLVPVVRKPRLTGPLASLVEEVLELLLLFELDDDELLLVDPLEPVDPPLTVLPPTELEPAEPELPLGTDNEPPPVESPVPVLLTAPGALDVLPFGTLSPSLTWVGVVGSTVLPQPASTAIATAPVATASRRSRLMRPPGRAGRGARA